MSKYYPEINQICDSSLPSTNPITSSCAIYCRVCQKGSQELQHSETERGYEDKACKAFQPRGKTYMLGNQVIVEAASSEKVPSKRTANQDRALTFEGIVSRD